MVPHEVRTQIADWTKWWLMEYLNHPINGGFGPAVRCFTRQCEWFALFNCFGNRSCFFEVIENWLTNKHWVWGSDTMSIFCITHVLTWNKLKLILNKNISYFVRFVIEKKILEKYYFFTAIVTGFGWKISNSSCGLIEVSGIWGEQK